MATIREQLNGQAEGSAAQLNEAQRQAVTTDSPHLLILAGAGTGKTRTLIHRIAWEIEGAADNQRQMMAVTFTNKAANELKANISKLLGSDTAEKWVVAGTFHSIAHRQLRQFGTRIGLPAKFTIMDSDDQKRLVRQLMRQENVNEQHYPANEFVSWLNRYKEYAVRAKDISETENTVYREMAVVYEKHCRKEGLVDFGELLMANYEMLETCADVREYYQNRFAGLFVDEFQDTNAIQYRWLKILMGPHTRTSLVGDDDQAIYGWRGARMQNIQDYVREFDAEVIRMEENYRSTSTILGAANKVIAKNFNRMGKTLFSKAEEGEKVRVYAAYNDTDEARFVAQIIEDWHLKGNRLADIAVLYRSNALSRILEEEMVRSHIPYHIYGGTRFYSRNEIKDALAWLQVIEQPSHEIAFVRAVRSPKRNVGEGTLNRMRAMAPGESIWQAAIQFARTEERAAKNIAEFVETVKELRQYAPSASLEKLMAEIHTKSGLEALYSKTSEGGISRQENLEELVRAAGHFQMQFSKIPPADSKISVVEQFLAVTSLDSGDEQGGAYTDAIHMMTIHASKGLEYPVVIIVGMEEQLLPHSKSMEGEGLEEERRLCYVGMTRGIKKLYMSWSAMRKMHGRTEYRRPSRFLGDLPPELVLEVEGGLPSDSSSAGSIQEPKNGSRYPSPAGSNGFGMRTGEAVFHKVFGEGVIVSSEGHGDDMRLRVNFSDHGTKLLLATHAGLVQNR